MVDSNARTRLGAILDDTVPIRLSLADDAGASHLEGRARHPAAAGCAAGLDLDLLLDLAGPFLAAGLIDGRVAHIAPLLIGGGSSRH